MSTLNLSKRLSPIVTSSKPGTYPQWSREFHDVSRGLPEGQVYCIAKIGDEIWAGTDRGISVKKGDSWGQKRGGGWPSRKVGWLLGFRDQVIAISSEGSLVYRNSEWVVLEEPRKPLAADLDSSGLLWICAEDGLWTYDGLHWKNVKRGGIDGSNLRDFRWLPDGPSNAVATSDQGLYLLQDKRLSWFSVQEKENGLLSNDTRCVRLDGSGQLWVTTDRGLSIYSGENGWCSITGEEGIPYEDLHQIELTRWGEQWIGTDAGLILLRDGRWKYFASRRWLPDDRINDILAPGKGEVWVATPNGICHLKAHQMTLEEKASEYERKVRKYHERSGYVTIRELEIPGDLSSGSVMISDNDGLWTGLYIAAEAFRYAANGEREAKRYARKSLDALMRLEEITGIPGLPARAIRGRHEPGFGDGNPEWHLTRDGNWEWKSDTSSDEIDGHYFALSTYFDLVDGKRDRDRIVSYTRRITDHIISHDYLLCDHDGEHTTFGVWSPEKLNQDDRWEKQRGLNSLEVLSYLKIAHHITGDERYQDEYLKLALDHHYALNMVKQRQKVLGRQIWHDDRLAYLAYYPLLSYEEKADLRQIYLLSLERTWRQLRGQRNSLWNIMTSAVTRKPHDIEAAVHTLEEYPLDLVDWTVGNSHRSDIRLDPDHPNRAMEPLPADERRLCGWAWDLHELDGGRDGIWAHDGTRFLLPYWMGRFHGFIDG